MNREWQYIGDDDWVFGVKVRGLVREFEASVWYDADRRAWHWSANTPDGLRTGFWGSMMRAIEEAEKTLGITE